jgi:hypothetical protein
VKIEKLRITIEPWRDRYDDSGMSELRLEVQANGGTFKTIVRFRNDDFVSMFDVLMASAKSEILRIVNENRPQVAGSVRCRKCGEYLPGHATGSGDICNCYTK